MEIPSNIAFTSATKWYFNQVSTNENQQQKNEKLTDFT